MLKESRHVDIGGLDFCVFMTPPAPVSVILLHGVTANLAIWTPVASRLSRHVQVVAMDQRGHGRSAKPACGYGATDFAGDVATLIESGILASRVFVVGHSLGARNAIELAAQRPELVEGVVAIDYTPFIETEVMDALDARVTGAPSHFETLEGVEDYLRARYRRLPEDAIAIRARTGFAKSEVGFRPLASASAMAQTVTGLRADLAPALQRLTVPTILVRGAESSLVSEDAWARTQELRPDISAVELADADHYVPEEVPDQVTSVILGLTG
ncbi:MAG: alpha/beta hydrolase [Actinobacteria bacterium]|nr:alpha/beta hydrolase [Actinomycetota bacterium]